MRRGDAWVPSSLCNNADLSGLSFPLYKRSGWGQGTGAGSLPVLMSGPYLSVSARMDALHRAQALPSAPSHGRHVCC